MAHVAFCLPALSSHAAVHGALAAELALRGHRCTFVGTEGLRPLARREGCGFSGLDFAEAPLQRAGLVRTLFATAATTRVWWRRGPELLGRLAPDLVICDQGEPGATLAAEAAGLCTATLASALPLDRDETIPPPFVDWPWLAGEAGIRRNRGGWMVTDALMTLTSRALAEGCRSHGLAVRTRLHEWISPTLDLRQLVAAMDFAHEPGPGCAPVGPLRRDEPAVDTIGSDDRPLVFASLGTLQTGRPGLLHAMAEAAAQLDVRLALAHAGGLSERQVRALPGNHVVRPSFAQRAVLSRSAACITHAGLNTVLDCVSARVPMVAIPFAFEQPGTAARIRHHGVGRVLSRRCSMGRIRDALREVLVDARYRQALIEPAQALAAAGGVARAADLVEALPAMVRHALARTA